VVFFFFFQAEDGIRDDLVTGVQTCALPISCPSSLTAISRPSAVTATTTSTRCSPWRPALSTRLARASRTASGLTTSRSGTRPTEIGRASCRERVEDTAVGGVGEDTTEEDDM